MENIGQDILLNGATTNTNSVPKFVGSSRNLMVEVTMVGFTGKLNLLGSLDNDIVDFSAGASLANPYDNVSFKDLNTGAVIAGDTGLTGTATTKVYLLAVNVPFLNWLGAKTSTVSAGSITVKWLGAPLN